MPAAVPPWYDVLRHARRFADGGGPESATVTAPDLAREAKMPLREASAWLAKFVKWGYAERVGSAPYGKRWVRLFLLTKSGMTRKPPTKRVKFEKR